MTRKLVKIYQNYYYLFLRSLHLENHCSFFYFAYIRLLTDSIIYKTSLNFIQIGWKLSYLKKCTTQWAFKIKYSFRKIRETRKNLNFPFEKSMGSVFVKLFIALPLMNRFGWISIYQFDNIKSAIKILHAKLKNTSGSQVQFLMHFY